MKIILIVGAIIFISLLFILILVFSGKNRKDDFTDTSCVCVFDLDNTITCSHNNAKMAIDECKKRNCSFAINTARPIPYHQDIRWDKLGLKYDDVKDDFYHGTWIEGLVSTLSQEELARVIAETKSRHLNTIHEKSNVPKGRIILFDDVYNNITDARQKGFSAIHANNARCGINPHVRSEISDILD